MTSLSYARLNVHRVKRSARRANLRRQRKNKVLLTRAKAAQKSATESAPLSIQHARRLTAAAAARRKNLRARLTKLNGGQMPNREAVVQLMCCV